MNSELLRLPAELHLKILRFIMEKNESLYGQHKLWPERYERNVELAAQILRTCQALYYEDSAVLDGKS